MSQWIIFEIVEYGKYIGNLNVYRIFKLKESNLKNHEFVFEDSKENNCLIKPII